MWEFAYDRSMSERAGSDGESTESYPRREILSTAGAATFAISAGCLGDDGDGEDDGGDDAGGGPGERVPPLDVEAGENANFVDVGRQFSNEWAENLGLEINFNTYEWATYAGTIYGEGDFEHIAHTPHGSRPSRLSPHYYYFMYSSEGQPYGKDFANPEWDELWTQYHTSFDDEERLEASHQLQELFREHVPALVYCYPELTLAYNSRLWEMEPTPFLNLRPTAQMSYFDAVPKTDEQTLVAGGGWAMEAANPLGLDSGGTQITATYQYDTLTKFTTDGELIPWAMESFQQLDEDRLEITLRDDLEFTDGEPLTAEDAAWTFNFYVENDFPSISPLVVNVAGAEATGEYEFILEFETPDNAVMPNYGPQLPLLPKHLWQEISEEYENPAEWEADADDLVGSGPFIMTQWDPHEVIYEVNGDHFYDIAYEEFVFTNIPSDEALRAAFVDEDIHATSEAGLGTAMVRELEGEDHLEVVSVSDYMHMKFDLKLDKPPFDDRAFREAMLLGVDLERLIDILWDGRATIANGSLVPPEHDEFNSDVPQLEPDIEEARQILEDAGYTWDDDGRLRYPEE